MSNLLVKLMQRCKDLGEGRVVEDDLCGSRVCCIEPLKARDRRLDRGPAQTGRSCVEQPKAVIELCCQTEHRDRWESVSGGGISLSRPSVVGTRVESSKCESPPPRASRELRVGDTPADFLGTKRVPPRRKHSMFG